MSPILETLKIHAQEFHGHPIEPNYDSFMKFATYAFRELHRAKLDGEHTESEIPLIDAEIAQAELVYCNVQASYKSLKSKGEIKYYARLSYLDGLGDPMAAGL